MNPFDLFGELSLARVLYILTRFLLTSSCAFSAFLSPRSSELTASLSAFTNSAGLFWDLPNNGILLSVLCGVCVVDSPNKQYARTILLRPAMRDTQ